MHTRNGVTRVRSAAAILISATAFFVGFTGPGGAQDRHDAAGQNAISVRLLDAAERADPTQQRAAAALLAKARAQRRVRVIAGLRLGLRDEHTVSVADRNRQTDALRTVQRAIVARVLGPGSAAPQRSAVASSNVVLFDYIPAVSLIVNASQLTRLLADPQVVHVQEDRPAQASLDRSTRIIEADKVWTEGILGTGHAVAVLDTGVDKTHPMLKGKVVSEGCYSTTDASVGAESLCPGGVASSTKVGSGLNCPASLTNCDHGTHVASIAAGKTSGDLRGVAPGAGIVAIQVFSRMTRGASCGGAAPCISSFQTDQIKGLERVYDLRNSFNIAAVNLSLGEGKYPDTCDSAAPSYAQIVAKLKRAGIGVVAAVGNRGYIGAIEKPACINDVIAVGSTDSDDVVPSSSNRSAKLRLLAPGVDIDAAVPGGGHQLKNGSSQAAPHVAGAFALHRHSDPAATVDEIASHLECTGRSVGTYIRPKPVFSNFIARPRIDVYEALGYRMTFGLKNFGLWDFSFKEDTEDWTPRLGTWTWSESESAYEANRWDSATSRALSGVWNCYRSFEITVELKMFKPAGTFGNAGTPILILKSSLDGDLNFSGLVFKVSESSTHDDEVAWDVEEITDSNLSSGGGQTSLVCQDYYSEPAPKGSITGGVRLTVQVRGNDVSYRVNGKLVCKFKTVRSAGATMIGAFLGPPGDGRKLRVQTVRIREIAD